MCFCISLPIYAQTIDFETVVPSSWNATTGSLTISNAHYKLGNESLRWDWVMNDTVVITTPNINPSDVLDFNKHTTELWVYNEVASSETIRFEYLNTANIVNYDYDFHLNFEGWRRISRSYKYDMHAIANPDSTIASIRILSPTTGNGTLYFDDWEYVKNRYTRIRNAQMPDIAGYLSDLDYWTIDNYTPDITQTVPTNSELSGLGTIRAAVLAKLAGTAPLAGELLAADNFYSNLAISVTGNQIKGRHTTPQDADVHLGVYARDYHHNGTLSSLQKAEEIIWLINDAGYASGSDLVYGWYDTRNYFTGLILIYNSLNPSLQAKIFDAIAWTFKMGEFWDPAALPGFDSDFVHTNLLFELGAISICINNDTLAIQQLKGFKRFLERKNVPTSSTQGWLKPDYTSFHHGTHYYAYMYSFSSYTTVLGCLGSTQFQINQTAYTHFKNAAYAFLIFCNGNQYANSLSGRHPFSTDIGMVKSAYNELAYVGGFIMGQTADPIIAGAYNRIWNDDAGLQSYPVETFPTGYWQFNYSPVGLYRQDKWVATLHGINQTFWGTEIYAGKNRYGRYQSYGAVEIMYSGGRDSSGMNVNGFDWNRQPGTTSKILPWIDLNPTAIRADERAKSDYAAALRFEGVTDELNGNYGMYGFDFQQKGITASHDESFKFKKSLFCFDSLIIGLGSNIQCTDPSHPIVTTLFQNTLSMTSSPLVVDAVAQTSFPYNVNLGTGAHWVLDSWNTGYYVNSMDSILVKKANQTAPHYSANGSTTSGDLASVWIDHGANPNHSSYEFVILPNSTAAKMQAFELSMQNTATRPYEILQQDSMAHIIYHKNSTVHAYAFFEPNVNLNDSMIESNDAACLVMLKEINGILELSLVDPSTSFNQAATIQLVLKGEYVIQTADLGVNLVSTINGRTTLTFEPRDGEPQDVILTNLLLNNNTLANDFLRFKAVKFKEKKVRIEWKVSNENTVEQYHVERSSDGSGWEVIHKQIGTTALYETYDQDPLKGNNYYRIKQIHWNNKVSYSWIEVVNFDWIEEPEIYPNPNTGIFNLSFPYDVEYEVTLLDVTGKTVFYKKMRTRNTVLDLLDLAAGTYTVQIRTETQSYHKKVTILP
jgi:hypothetical protein